jgi:hypothetical protein
VNVAAARLGNSGCLWLRARYGLAKLDQNNVRTTFDEVRLILNYRFKLYWAFDLHAGS